MKIAEFRDYIRGLSPMTQATYEQTLWQLSSRIAGEEPTSEEIANFLLAYNPSTLNRHQAAIKAYLEFRGIGWSFNRRQFPSRRKHIPRYINPSDVEAIANAAEREEDRMFIETLFTLGCRITELRGIDSKDIESEGVRLTVKGGRERLIPVTGDFRQTLKSYAKGKQGKLFPETYWYYYKTLKELCRKAGVKEVSPHILRHARAVDLLRKGMPLPFVQQFLHHASINTTAIYLEITGGELADELEKVEGGESEGKIKI